MDIRIDISSVEYFPLSVTAQIFEWKAALHYGNASPRAGCVVLLAVWRGNRNSPGQKMILAKRCVGQTHYALLRDISSSLGVASPNPALNYFNVDEMGPC